MTKTAAGFSENPDSTDNLVRDLEESGYPVDGETAQFAPQPDSLTVESDRPGSRSGETRRCAQNVERTNRKKLAGADAVGEFQKTKTSRSIVAQF